MSRDLNHAMEYSSKWIEIINKKTVPEEEGKWIIDESKYNFAEHFNRGWLEYRKSVTVAGQGTTETRFTRHAIEPKGMSENSLPSKVSSG